MYRTILLVAFLGLTGNATAQTYEWEFGARYTATNSDIDFGPVSVFGTDGDTLVNLPVSTLDTDALQLSATWFLNGLQVDNGPRTEAPFLTRASSLSFNFERAKTDSTSGFIEVIDNQEIIGVTERSETTSNFGFGGRYVWDNTGWFVTGDYRRSERDAGVFTDELTTLTAGFGRYIAKNTTLSVLAGRTERDIGQTSDSSSGIILNGKHIGDLSNDWKYGAELSLSSQSFGGATGRYDGEFSLFPNNDVALRLGTSGQIGGGGTDQQQYLLGAGWFVTADLEITAGYQWLSFDEQDDVDVDADGFSLGINWRF